MNFVDSIIIKNLVTSNRTKQPDDESGESGESVYVPAAQPATT
jgi:hypothetical protein